ncbi:hypothetical protein EB836_04050 [Brevibacterium sp. S111]|nr:hypothetical protein EB836_04050 [Brevibacterium sp. S111]
MGKSFSRYTFGCSAGFGTEHQRPTPPMVWLAVLLLVKYAVVAPTGTSRKSAARMAVIIHALRVAGFEKRRVTASPLA